MQYTVDHVVRIAAATVIALILAVLIPQTGAAQNTDGPGESVQQFLDDVKLGVQVQANASRASRDIVPLQKNALPYLQETVSGTATYSVPSYGLGVTLRYHDWSLAFDYFLNDGVESQSWLSFRDGGNAIPIEPSVQQWTLEGEYFWHDNLGVGLGYRDAVQTLLQDGSTPIRGEQVRSILFQANSSQEVIYAFISLRYDLSFGRLYGRVGASVHGRASESYSTQFVQYQNPDAPGRTTGPTTTDVEGTFRDASASMNVQFARAGLSIPVSQVVLRGGLHGERASVSSLSTTWSYGVHFEVGLPF
jgi:hypothetical protein